jgi:succinate-semialdehyde dehydrogenase/glutarate-semialdehyde dehydrogenase
MTSLSKNVPTQNLIAGVWGPAKTGKTFAVLNPATDDELCQVPDADAGDGLAAVAAAHAAGPSWAATAPRVRGEVLRKTYELMIERREEIATLITQEMGKALPDSRAEVNYAAEFFRWFSEEAVRIGGEVRRAPAGDKWIMTNRVPVGVCYFITPWNFPAAMATRKIGPAIAAGCTVVVKPAAETPLTTLYIAKLMEEAGLPAGVVNVITTHSASAVSEAILKDERVAKISFTGSTFVGKKLLHQAADRVLRTSMELGGNDPFIVCEDADVAAAVDGAMLAKMRNGGQACTAANRFYVHEKIYDEFAAAMTARMAALVVGDGLDDKTQCGPVVSHKQKNEIAGMVDGALAQGAKRVAGDPSAMPAKGAFYPPTVLVDVPKDSDIARNEIFGPVAPLIKVSSDEEALRLANASEFGLIGYIYTKDLAKGLRLSARLETGMVGLNRGLVSDPAAPFGGMKESGLGREGGFEGIDEFLETQYVAVEW